MNKIIIAIAKPFNAFPRGQHNFSISTDGTVWVWDSVAGHYTTCHSLSAQAQARIRKLAS